MPQYFKHSYKSSAAGLPLVVKNVGFQQCPPGYHWGAGMRDHYLLHYVVSGCGTYTLGGQSYPVHAGQVFLAWPNTLIRYCADEHDPWEYYWLGVTGPDAAALIAQSGIRPDAPVRTVGFGRSLQHYITAIYDARGQSAWSRTQMLGYAYLLLGKLIEGHEEIASPSDMVERAAEFISNNYTAQITIDDVAAYAGVSRSWLYRGFQRRFGVSPPAIRHAASDPDGAPDPRDRLLCGLCGRAVFFQGLFPPHGALPDRLPRRIRADRGRRSALMLS